MKLREAAPSGPDGSMPVRSIPIEPLRISGMIGTRQDLIDSLRAVFVPSLADLQVDESGETFFLTISQRVPTEEPAAGR